MANASYAARQPPAVEGEKPVRVLVTGFGVSANFLHHFPVPSTPSQSFQALLCRVSSFLYLIVSGRSLLVHAGSLETTCGREGFGTWPDAEDEVL